MNESDHRSDVHYLGIFHIFSYILNRIFITSRVYLEPLS